MAPPKSSFLDKVLGRIGRLDAEGLQTVVQRLARERNFLETLFNTIEDGVLVVDENGKVLYLNQAVTRLLGLQANAVEEQPIQRFFPELNWEELLRQDREGRPSMVRHEFEVTYPRPRFIRLYAAPLDGEASGSSGVALILHDATEARQKTYQAIETEKIQALTLLAASVAHEIGNPLNALHIHLQLMERELRKFSQRTIHQESAGAARARQEEQKQQFVEKMRHYLGVAKGEISRLDYIITQFLQAIRPTPPQIVPHSLNEVARETMELLMPEFKNRGLEMDPKLSPHLPLVPMDPAQMKQCLVNLSKNAMQAMTRGGVLTLQTGEGMEGVWVSVADTGPGIPQEQINRIFEPFYTTKKKGTGLGLMIVQRIVRSHGGRIEVWSDWGKGTTFRIWLPLHERPVRLLEARSDDQTDAANRG